jgi:soluble lytic murein transglycosylase
VKRALWVFLILILGGALLLFYWWRERREHRFDAEIQKAAAAYNLDPALIKAVIWKESRFRPDVKGTKEEYGLMQIQDVAAHEWAEAARITNFVHEHTWDPTTNILAGSFYLSKLLKRYRTQDNPIPYALADYNAGRSHVLRWRKGAALTNSAAFIAQIDYPTTRDYIQSVMEHQTKYQREFRQ